MEVDGIAWDNRAKGEDCIADDGYTDISEGAEVLMLGADETKLAVTHLEAGVLTEDLSRCEFAFTFGSVPEGETLYGIHVGNENRGSLTKERAELDVMVRLSIG